MDIKIIFGKHLQNLRNEKGLTQDVLSEKAGMDRSYLSEVERGLKAISIEKLYQLAQALEIELWELMKF